MNISSERKRDLRQTRIPTRLPVNGDRYAISCAIRKWALTRNDIVAYTTGMTLKRDLLESFLRDIDADFQAQLNARMEEVRKELEGNRRKAIEALYKAWPEMGGSEKDLDILATELETSLGDSPLEIQENGRQSKNSQGQTVSMSVIRRKVQEVVAQTEYDGVITQTEIKDRILNEYPNAKVPSVRSAISRLLSGYLDLGELELAEEGKAGAPNKYRRKKRETEGNLLRS